MKYNWSIIGHSQQLLRIERDIKSGNLFHAYLLAGTNSVGKYTVAKKMAGIIQCANDFCHKCPSCVQIEKGSHIDTCEMTGKESIKLKEVKEMIERINRTGQSKYKVFLIQGVERMTLEAANSFLKVLEEPPQDTVFIMTTDNVRDVLPTIISRVRMVKFSSVSVGFLREKLKELYPDTDEETLESVSLFSLGKTGKAIHLMENPDSLLNYKNVYNTVQGFLGRRNIVDRFLFVEGLLAEEKQINVFLNILTHVLRSRLLNGEGDSKQLINLLLKIEETSLLLKKNVNSRLVLENLMLKI